MGVPCPGIDSGTFMVVLQTGPSAGLTYHTKPEPKVCDSYDEAVEEAKRLTAQHGHEWSVFKKVTAFGLRTRTIVERVQ